MPIEFLDIVVEALASLLPAALPVSANAHAEFFKA
jgi:hypothetical protein